jgi:hypothetical protein
MRHALHTPTALPNLLPGEFSKDFFHAEPWTPPTYEEMAAFMDDEMQRLGVGPFAAEQRAAA